MRIFSSKYIPVALTIAAGLVGATGMARKPDVSDTERARAEYLFMEANSRLQDNNPAAAYYMLRRAAAIAPADVDIAAAKGELVIYSGIGDSADFENAYRDMKARYFARPRDVHSAQKFAQVAGQLRRVNDLREVYVELCRQYPGRQDFALEDAWYKALGYLDGDTTAIDSANAIYDRLEAATGPGPELSLHRLRTLMLARDTTAMTGVVHRYLASTPENAESAFSAGQMFRYIGLGDSALVYYNRACALDSTYGPAYLARAEHYMSEGDSASYDREVLHALGSPSLEFAPKLEILTNYTRALYQQPERQQAISRLFSKMLDIHPGEPNLHNLYGAYLAAVDSTAAASEQFGYAMDLDPDVEEYARFHMQTALESGDTVTALNAARIASRRFSNLFFPVSGASVLMTAGRNEEAIEMLDSFDISGQENPHALSIYYQLRGDILHAMHHNDSAYVNYEKAVNLDPSNIGVLNNIAYYMAQDGVNLDRAERYIRQVLLEEPLNPTYIDTYAWVLFKQKDYPAARRQIDAALRIYDDRTDSLLAATDIAVPDVSEAPAENDTAQADSPEADVAEMAEVVEEAVEATEPETPSAEIYDHAGDIYFMTGDHREAVEFWKKALLLDPENERIKKKVKHKAYFFE